MKDFDGRILKVALTAALMIGAASVAPAQDATPDEALAPAVGSALPGGANALSETHGDWQVNCRMVTVEDTGQKQCALTQRQVNQQGQNVLAVEFATNGDGLSGAIVLPFGLAVTEPVTLAVDEGEATVLPFSTCVPAGCLVPVDVTDDMRAALRSGSTLAISAQGLDGSPISLAVSLAGFGSAANRVAELSGS